MLATDGEPADRSAASLRPERARGLAGFEVGDAWTADFVVAAHAERLLVYAYTVNDEPTMRRLIGIGIDTIETDELARLLSVVRGLVSARQVSCLSPTPIP